MPAIYLDNNATTQPAALVVEAMLEALRDGWANPSSVHRAGQAVRARLELAREQVAMLVGVKPREVIFTSGGTEASNLAIMGSLSAVTKGRRVLVTSRIEHAATRDLARRLQERGVEVAWTDITPTGEVDTVSLARLLEARSGEVAVVSLQWVNNETGIIQPVKAIGDLCRAHGARLHLDGTQWVGKMPTNLAETPCDLLTLSPHKFHGPKGVGALVVRRGVRIEPEIIGGPQERERRGGTENVPGIIGMGVAAGLARAWLTAPGTSATTHEPEMSVLAADIPTLRARRDWFERAILDHVADATIHGAGAERIWNTTNIAFPRLEAEAILLMLSERGVFASAGAACSSGSLDPSPVLLAMGVPPEAAHGSIRFSMSRDTAERDLIDAAGIVTEVIMRLRRGLAAV